VSFKELSQAQEDGIAEERRKERHLTRRKKKKARRYECMEIGPDTEDDLPEGVERPANLEEAFVLKLARRNGLWTKEGIAKTKNAPSIRNV
jgi:hypothetical protein